MICSCHCGPASHAPLQDFGVAMCLSPGCDCDGFAEAVTAMLAERIARRPDSKLERLVSLVREVLSNPLPRSIEDSARNVAAAIVAAYEVEER